MDPLQFLQLARNLSRRGDPASCRTAIGRAYFAFHNVAADILGSHVRIPSSAEAHGKIVQCLINGASDEVRRAGSQLNDLRSSRNRADYNMADRSSEQRKTAEFCVQNAQRNITALKQAFSGADAKRNIEAMKAAAAMLGL